MIRIPIVSEYNNKGQKQAETGIAGLGGKIGQMQADIMSAFAVAPLADFAWKAVQAASDLNESANAVKVTYGAASDEILKLGEDAVMAYGMSTTQFGSFAVSFSGFAETVTADGGDIQGTIDDMATRIADFASVHNLDIQEAQQIFQSAMAGETEAVRRFGIDLSETAVKNFALAEGIIEVGDQMTEAEKTTARYGLLMQETQKVAGDFTNTQDGLANSSRTLKAAFEDLTADIGQVLLPQVETLTGDLLFLTETWEKIPSPAKSAIQGIGADIASQLNPVSQLRNQIGDIFDLFAGDETEEAARNTEDLERTYWNLKYATEAGYRQQENYYEALRESGQQSRYAESGIDELQVIMGEAEEAAEELWGETATLNEELKKLRGEIDNRDAWRGLHDQYVQTIGDVKEFGASSRDGKAAVDELRLEVLDYAEALNLPPQKTTEILTLLDQGKLDEVNALLLRLEGGVTLPVKPQLIPGTGLRVDENGNVRLAGMGGSGGTVNVTVNPPAGSSGTEIVKALQRTVNRTGSIPVPVSTTRRGL